MSREWHAWFSWELAATVARPCISSATASTRQEIAHECFAGLSPDRQDEILREVEAE